MQVAVVIRLSALGDVMLTSPAVQALAKTHRIVFVTDAAYVPIVRALPGVSEARGLDRKAGIAGARQLGRELRELKPVAVFDLQNKVRTQVLARTTGAPVKNLSRRTWGQSVSALFGRDTVLNDQHQTERYLQAVGANGSFPLGPLTIADEWRTSADELAANANWDRPALAIAPAATHATKGWPIERFAETTRRLAVRGSPLLVVAGPKDTESVATYRSALGDWPRTIDASSLSLTTMIALLARCRLLVGNDSGPIHLATALGVPTVALFGPTSVRRWGPMPGDASHRAATLNLGCAPCSNHGGPTCPLGHHDCLQKLPVDLVEREALMAESNSPNQPATSSTLRKQSTST